MPRELGAGLGNGITENMKNRSLQCRILNAEISYWAMRE